MARSAQPWAGGRAHRCARCQTELAPHALSCPACQSLVHADRLRELAARATRLTTEDRLVDARESWKESLALLPTAAQQHATIARRIFDLDARIAATQPSGGAVATPQPHRVWWKTWAATAIGVVLLFAGKLKFLLLGLTKAKTFFSMFAFFGVYWTTYGWPLALGLVLSIYVHEMGHVAMLRRFNIHAGAPLFIPGLGAMILLKQRIEDPRQDAAIGLAGPVWGLGAGLVALAVYGLTSELIWLAIAALTGLINLFNLTPVWQLDGARAFHALTAGQRWIVVAALAVAFFMTGQKLLIIVGAVAVWRALQREAGPGDQRVLGTFLILIGALAWMSKLQAL